jgi:hypothetical protein
MPERSRIEKTKNVVEILALVIAGFWAIWLFAYKDIMLPSRVPTFVTVDGDLNIIGKKDDLLVVKSVVRIKNGSSVRALIVGSSFNVRAYVVMPKAKPSLPSEKAALIMRPSGDFIDLPQWAEIGVGEIMSSGRLFPANGWWIDAGEEQEIEFVVFVPARYNLLSQRCVVHLAKESSSQVRTKWEVASDSSVHAQIFIGTPEESERYDSAKHSDMLGDANPYKSYSAAWLAIPEAYASADAN